MKPPIMKRDTSNDYNNCDASATDWAALILSIISINVSWWAFEIPVLFKKGVNLKALASYVQAVFWTCVRICLPSYVFVLVIRDKELTPAQWSKAFYDGPWSVNTTRDDTNESESPVLSKFGVAKALIFDTIGVAAVGLSVSKLWRVDSDQILSGMNASTWSFPALPVSVFGLWIQIAGFMKLAPRWVLVIGFALVVLVGAVLTIAMHFSHQPGAEFAAMALYIPMAIPIAFVIPIGRRYILFLTYIAVVFSRVGGMAMGAMSKDGTFPFCSLWGPKFAIPYFLFGALASVLAWLCGPNILNAFWAKRSLRNGLNNDREAQAVQNPRFSGPQANTELLPTSDPPSQHLTTAAPPYSSDQFVSYHTVGTVAQPQSAHGKPQMYATVTQVEDHSPYIYDNLDGVGHVENQSSYVGSNYGRPIQYGDQSQHSRSGLNGNMRVEDQAPYVPSNSGWR